MANDSEGVCGALAYRFIRMLYDGVTGMNVKPGLIATDTGARELRRVIGELRQQDMSEQRTLRDVEFDLEKVASPKVPRAVMQVTVTERFSAQYDSLKSQGQYFNGRRRHYFRMMVDETGNNLLVDGYDLKQLSERRGKVKIRMRQLERTVQMNRRPEKSLWAEAKLKEKNKKESRYPWLWNAGTRKLLLVLVALSFVGMAYFYFFGTHTRLEERCLYTGGRRITVTAMNRLLYQRHPRTRESKWVESLYAADAGVEAQHYWVPHKGWDQESFETRTPVEPLSQTELAMETLQVIHWYHSRDPERAIRYLQQYHNLVARTTGVIEKQEEAEPWEDLKTEYERMRTEILRTQ